MLWMQTSVPLPSEGSPYQSHSAIRVDQHRLQRPLPTNNGNKDFIMVVDECSRFPFVFHVLMCLRTQSLSALHRCSHLLECQHTSIQTAELHLWAESYANSCLRKEWLQLELPVTNQTETVKHAERSNGVIWKAVTMSLKSRNLPLKNWQDVLPDALHSVRSLLYTATNETPHERVLWFLTSISAGASIPTWLATPGPVYIKRQVSTSKMDSLVDDVELLQANPQYPHVPYPEGRETTWATKHLAPKGQVVETLPVPERIPEEAENFPIDTCVGVTPDAEPSSTPQPQPGLTPVQNVEPAPLRRSQRVHRPVVRLDL